FEALLRQVKAIIETMPSKELGSKLLLLDNWNEWSEGHYIAPHREYGFGYLDAVRRVFSDAPEKHKDLIPADIGLGPYDSAYKGR
ncbi:MAG: glycoside hydrolase family 99-like domain-containing protein, partial [Limisphaerales bacterium]